MSARLCLSCGTTYDYEDGTDPVWCGRCNKKTVDPQAVQMNPPPPWLRPRPTAPTGPLVPDPEALERHAGEIAAREAEQARDVRTQDALTSTRVPYSRQAGLPPRQLTCGCCTEGCVCRIHCDVPRGIRPRHCAAHGGPRFLEI